MFPDSLLEGFGEFLRDNEQIASLFEDGACFKVVGVEIVSFLY